MYHQPPWTLAPIKAGTLILHTLMPLCFLAGTHALCQAHPIKITTGNDYPPFTDSRAVGGGVLTELVTLVLANMDRRAEITYLPWARGYQQTLSGKFAATFPYIKTPDREQKYYYSEPLLTIPTRIFVQANNNYQFHNFDDFTGKRLCSPIGYALSQRIDEALQTRKIFVSSPRNMTSCFKMMNLGRVDFIVMNEYAGWLTVIREFGNTDAFKTIGPPLEQVAHYLIVPKNHAGALEFLKAFNQSMKALQASGEIDQLLEARLNWLSPLLESKE